MKLIELLVQELPKRGGWPKSAIIAESYSHIPGVHFWDTNGITVPFDDLITNAIGKESVTREQYEAALAAAQQPVWDGEGLPPVGMHCEIVDPDGALMYGRGESGEVVAHVEYTADIRMSYGLGCCEARCLRPARPEADKNRDAIIDALFYYTTDCDAIDIYKAIAAGKIPGVKLDV